MPPILVPDAGPLITLAYANSLDVLLLPGWRLEIVDMVEHEVTRNQTPTSDKITRFITEHAITIIPTTIHTHYQQQVQAGNSPRKTGLGEFAIQEHMSRLGLADPVPPAVFLFEDHKIAKTGFYVPEHVHKISTRAFLVFLEEEGWITSASDIEQQAIRNGRQFSTIRYP